jgi:hypothetical protein
MAREEEARENLLREAVALISRVELKVEGFDEPVVGGFRRDGAASFFFGQQIVYQFNQAGELRRGFFDGKLFKAEDRRLVKLTRDRTDGSVNLLRHELTFEETAKFLSTASRLLRMLDVAGRIRKWLENLSATIPLAKSPRVG